MEYDRTKILIPGSMFVPRDLCPQLIALGGCDINVTRAKRASHHVNEIAYSINKSIIIISV